MSDLDSDLEALGRRVAPDVDAARNAVLRSDQGVSPTMITGTGRRRAGTVLVATLAATGIGLVLAVSVAVAHRSVPGSRPGPASAATGAGAVISGTSSSATVSTSDRVSASGTVSVSGTVSTVTGSSTGAATVIGPATFPPSSATPAPTAASPSLPAGTITAADSGRTVVLHVGQQLVVDLAVGGLRWTVPTASDTAVLARMEGISAPDGSSRATFRGAAVGQAMVFAAGNPACAPRCGSLSRTFEVTVEVVA